MPITTAVIRTEIEREQVYGSIMFILRRDHELACRVSFELGCLADDEQPEAGQARLKPVCDHCGEPAEPYFFNHKGRRVANWSHLDGFFHCGSIEATCTVNGDEEVPTHLYDEWPIPGGTLTSEQRAENFGVRWI